MYEQAGNIVERDYNPNSGLAPAPTDSAQHRLQRTVHILPEKAR